MARTGGIGDFTATGLPNMGLGSLNLGNMLDTVEFVKNAWSSFGIPSGLAPTVDLDEIDRRISDLKAVEQWLTLNLNLLQTSVQALEIQRGTIATLQAYGDTLAAQSIPGAQALAQALAAAAASGTIAPPPRDTGAAARTDPVARGTPAPGAEASNTSPMGGATAESARMTAAAAAQTGQAGRRAEASPRATDAARATPSGAAGATTPGTGAAAQPGVDPAAWWDLLQRQFHDLASAALGGATPAKPAAARAGGGKSRRAGAATKGGAPVAPARNTSAGPAAAAAADPQPKREAGKAKAAKRTKR